MTVRASVCRTGSAAYSSRVAASNVAGSSCTRTSIAQGSRGGANPSPGLALRNSAPGIASAEVLGAVGLEPVDQGVGVAQCEQVAAGHLVRGDAQALLGDAAGEVQREQAVVAAHQDPGRNLRPRVERPWLAEDVLRLAGDAVVE